MTQFENIYMDNALPQTAQVVCLSKPMHCYLFVCLFTYKIINIRALDGGIYTLHTLCVWLAERAHTQFHAAVVCQCVWAQHSNGFEPPRHAACSVGVARTRALSYNCCGIFWRSADTKANGCHTHLHLQTHSTRTYTHAHKHLADGVHVILMVRKFVEGFSRCSLKLRELFPNFRCQCVSCLCSAGSGGPGGVLIFQLQPSAALAASATKFGKFAPVHFHCAGNGVVDLDLICGSARRQFT